MASSSFIINNDDEYYIRVLENNSSIPLQRTQFQSGTELFQKKQYDRAIDLLSQCLNQFQTERILLEDLDGHNSSFIQLSSSNWKQIAALVDKSSLELVAKVLITRGLCFYNSTLSSSLSESDRELKFQKAIHDFNNVCQHFKLYKKLYFAENEYEYLLYKDWEALNLFLSSMKAHFLEARCLQQMKERSPLRLSNGGDDELSSSPTLETAITCFSEAISMAKDLKQHLDIVANVNNCTATLEQLPQYFLNRGLCYNDIASYELAISDFTTLISMTEKESSSSSLTQAKKQSQLLIAYHNRGIAHASERHYNEAIEDFTIAISCFNSFTENSSEKKQNLENYVQTLNQRARILQKYIADHIFECKSSKDEKLTSKIVKYKKMACDDYDLVIKLNPSNTYPYRFNASQLLILVANSMDHFRPKQEIEESYLKAIPHLKDCISQKPSFFKLYLDLARCLQKTNQNKNSEELVNLYDKSIQLMETEIEGKWISKTQKANIYFERGVLNNKLPDKADQSISDFTKAISFNSEFTDAYFNRALIYYLKKKKFDLSMQDLRKVVEINPNDIEAHLEIVMISVELRKFEDAKKVLQTILELDPDNAIALNYMEHLRNHTESEISSRSHVMREEHAFDEDMEAQKKKKGTSDKSLKNLFKRKDSKSREEKDPSEEHEQSSNGKKLFFDPNFPPGTKSLLGTGNLAEFQLPAHIKNLETGIVWLRPHEIAGVTKPSLFVDGHDFGDVMQGALGNCWIMSGFSIVANYPHLMKKIILESKCDPSIGKYTFCFFKEGESKQVVIDDLIPCDALSRSYLFSCSRDSNELWVPLLEKAYASLYGNYYALMGGHLKDSLVDLTGGIPFTCKVSSQNIEEIWNLVCSLPKQNTDLTRCKSIKLMGARSETSASDFTGIINFHAYAIIEAIELPSHLTNGKRVRLIKMKNPWANSTEWRGDWSDSSSLWTPELRKFVGNQFNTQDGIFFMSLEYFAVQWNLIEGVEVFNPSNWSQYITRGFFDANIRSDNDWTADLLEETQFLIENPTDNNRIIISLAQFDTRYDYDKKNTDSCIAIHLLQYDKPFAGRNSSRINKIQKKSILVQNEYMEDREVVIDKVLPAGTYVAIPHEYFTTNCADAECGSYTLRIVSEKKVNIFELKP
ncbi:hypothetical protein C9374_010342 [Naegleria lovaniensis]|uniref:Calpain catalytic domain-containing protein n=1 Tax=Naegleria lovaniensis TaxID=51637 RepID=A0AA88GHI4_NAELO|nr:uncharacterized protein C9374_010342 [Naegleria lovaniensis]KAG2374968.1 hypothetical protein C9374_010342 [Naegleria lovaniensis]